MKNVGLDLLRYNVGKLMKFIDYRFVAADKRLATKQDKLTAGSNITISNNVISATGNDSAAMKSAMYNAVASAVFSLRTDRSCDNKAIPFGTLYGSVSGQTLTLTETKGSNYLTSAPIFLKKGDKITIYCNYDCYTHCTLYVCNSYVAGAIATNEVEFDEYHEKADYVAKSDCVVFLHIADNTHKYVYDTYTLVDNNRLIFREILPSTKLSEKMTSAEIGLIETFIENRFGAEVTIGNNTMDGIVNEIYDAIRD